MGGGARGRARERKERGDLVSSVSSSRTAAAVEMETKLFLSLTFTSVCSHFQKQFLRTNVLDKSGWCGADGRSHMPGQKKRKEFPGGLSGSLSASRHKLLASVLLHTHVAHLCRLQRPGGIHARTHSSLLLHAISTRVEGNEMRSRVWLAAEVKHWKNKTQH